MTVFLSTDRVPSWLDDIEGEQALEWAKAWSDGTSGRIPGPGKESGNRTALEQQILSALDADDRIPFPARRGEHLYNFWVDSEHPRGLWRRTTLDSYLDGSPGSDGGATEWETVLDLDALAEQEDENWVWKGSHVLRPNYDRALLRLSRGGADAVVIREFDLVNLRFLDDCEDGTEAPFTVSEAKTDVSWAGPDLLYIGTDLGEGTLTDSGYPRQVRKWRRGEPLERAEIVYEGASTDVAVGAGFDLTEGFKRLFVERAIDFYNSESFVEVDGDLRKIDVPDDCEVSVHREHLIILPRTDFGAIPSGALAVADLKGWLDGDRESTILFSPDEHTSLKSFAWTENYLVLTLLHDVATVLKTFTITGSPAEWEPGIVEGLPEQATVQVAGTSPTRDDEIWLLASSTLQPSTLLRGGLGEIRPEVVRSAPERFNAAGMSTIQHWATSADGTKIPYRVSGYLNGEKRPTLVNAYGGFEVSLLPGYSAVSGIAWLSQGGLAVQANLRGGGEFGPQWHSQAVKLDREKVFEDHRAVLQDLVERGYTDAETLAVRGGSNGGLLTAVCLTSYPELVGAVVSQVPLADMMRYHRLSAGASWMAEYGDPDDPAEREVIKRYSPVQRVAAATDRTYPPVLVTTSTRDDRVHPAHARSLAWLLKEAGQPVDYWENIEGGHGGAADNKQAAFAEALIYSWITEKISTGR